MARTHATPTKLIGDPQASIVASIIDALSDDQVLALLGPSWWRMTPAERRAYGYSGRRMPDRALPRRWWEAA